jgi:mannose-6-phosphate isomerase-like protein (cupin superfamily)
MKYMLNKISLLWSFLIISAVGIVFSSIIVFVYIKPTKPTNTQTSQSNNYYGNIVKETQENENFRRVLFTGPNSQLVVMSILPGGEIGEETHKYTEQTLFFLSGTGEATLNGKSFPIGAGDVVVVTSGTKHNFRNTGTEALKVYTVYAPPNHIDGRVHRTKADADADTADEAVGELEPLK